MPTSGRRIIAETCWGHRVRTDRLSELCLTVPRVDFCPHLLVLPRGEMQLRVDAVQPCTRYSIKDENMLHIKLNCYYSNTLNTTPLSAGAIMPDMRFSDESRLHIQSPFNCWDPLNNHSRCSLAIHFPPPHIMVVFIPAILGFFS